MYNFVVLTYKYIYEILTTIKIVNISIHKKVGVGVEWGGYVLPV